VGDVDVEPLGDQTVGNRRREQFFIFDHEYAHPSIVPVREPSRCAIAQDLHREGAQGGGTGAVPEGGRNRG
jgi:hypothetical protein